MAKSKDPLTRIVKNAFSRVQDADTAALSAPEIANYTANIGTLLNEGTRFIERKLSGDPEARTYRKVNTSNNIWDFLIPVNQKTLLPNRIFGAGGFGSTFEGRIEYDTYNCREFYAQEEAHEFLKTGDMLEKLKEILGELPKDITGEHRDLVFKTVHDQKLAEAQRMNDKEIVKIMEKRYKKTAPKGRICIKLSWLPEELKRMYKREKLVAGLDHKNLAYVFAVDEVSRAGTPDDKTMLIMTAQELIENIQTKNEFSKTGLEQKIDYAIQIGEGLRELHRLGLMHRDFKSSNVLITKDGTVKIIDNGLMKKLDGKQSSRTGAGQIIGSPAYFSPEQAIGGEVDTRADIYTVGATLYEFLIGTPPNMLVAERVEDITAVLLSNILPLMPSQTKAVNGLAEAFAKNKGMSKTEIPRILQDIDVVFAKLLHRDRDKRYQTIRAYLADMRALQKGERPPCVYEELESRKVKPEQFVTEAFSYHLGGYLKDKSLYKDAEKSHKRQIAADKGTASQRYILKPLKWAGASIATAAAAGGAALAIAYPELTKQIVDYIAGK